jgi:hypothetical protein
MARRRHFDRLDLDDRAMGIIEGSSGLQGFHFANANLFHFVAPFLSFCEN